MLPQIGYEDFEVRRYDLHDVDSGAHDPVDEALRVEDRLLLDDHHAPTDQQRRH